MKKIINILSFFIITGFIIGIILPSIQISVNNYLYYGMFRISGYLLQTMLNQWIFRAVAVSLIVIGIYSTIHWLFIPYLSRILKFQVIDQERFLFSLSFTLSLFIFIIVGWVLNHYYLPNRFHLISLITDFILLIIAGVIGWFSYKMGWHILFQLFKYERIWLKVRKSAMFVCVFLIICNIISFKTFFFYNNNQCLFC